jgi:hypothetical protein
VQSSDFGVDFGQALAHELLGVPAWKLAAIHHGQEITFFSEAETDALCAADEPEPLH